MFIHLSCGLLSIPLNCRFILFPESFSFVSIPPLPKLKNCEGFEILLFLEMNKLALHNSMDASRGHETPGSETKDFIPLAASASTYLCLFSLAPSLTGATRWMLHTWDVCITAEEHWDGKSTVFIADSKQAWSLSKEGCTSSLKVPSYITTLRNSPG